MLSKSQPLVLHKYGKSNKILTPKKAFAALAAVVTAAVSLSSSIDPSRDLPEVQIITVDKQEMNKIWKCKDLKFMILRLDDVYVPDFDS